MADYSYRIASGHDVALSSLVNVEDISQIGEPPRTLPVNTYPQRTKTLNGRVHGDGEIIHDWTWGYLPMTAITYVISNLLTVNGTVAASQPVTLYTRRRDLGADEYRRYNAYIEYPQPDEHYELDGDTAVNVRLRFHGLVAI